MCSSEKQVHLPVRFGNNITKFKMNQKEEIGELKDKFCQSAKLEFSSVRLLLNGQRLEDSDTVALISLIDGDVIEAFLELSGGGKPENAKNLTNEQEILNALEESFEVSDDLNSDSDSEQRREDSTLTEHKEEY